MRHGLLLLDHSESFPDIIFSPSVVFLETTVKKETFLKENLMSILMDTYVVDCTYNFSRVTSTF